MIDVMFEFESDFILIKIEGKKILFANLTYGSRLTTIEGLRLDQKGVLKEFPDLKNDKNWKLKAIDRFNNKIENMKDENEIAEYVIDDLKKFGYIPRYKQKKGFRIEKLI